MLTSEPTDSTAVQRNITKIKMAMAGSPPDAISAEVERYLRSLGATPADEAPAAPKESFTDVQSGASSTGDVGHVEGLARAGMQGASLGLGDELEALMQAPQMAGMTGKGLTETYKALRDNARGRMRTYSEDNRGLATAAEIAGSLPTAAIAGPLGGIKAGAAFGGLSGFGHSEGGAQAQLEGTATGTALGGLFGGLGRTLAKGGNKALDLINPKRIARRELASSIPDDAASTFSQRMQLAPKGTVPGDLAPETSGLGNQLAKSPKAGLLGRREAFARVKEIGRARKTVGAEYNALDKPLPIDPTIATLADEAGIPLKDATMTKTSFAEVHRLRHEVQKMAARAKGMSKHDLVELKQGIDSWLKQMVPAVEGVDSRYSPLSQQLTDALNSLKHTRQGVMSAARRGVGGNQRAAVRPLSIWHTLARTIEPSPARQANALRQVAFNPATAQREMGNILGAQQQILQGTTPWAGRMAGAAVGGLMAPQLSGDTAKAQAQAVQMRGAGMTNEQMQQQLGSVYTPEVVRFIIAATPQRMSQ